MPILKYLECLRSFPLPLWFDIESWLYKIKNSKLYKQPKLILIVI